MGADPEEMKINRQMIGRLEMSIRHLDTDAREQLNAWIELRGEVGWGYKFGNCTIGT